ncbi:MAG: T9SS C-terminal target domain-containing protein [Ignavibacteriales bacterium]|nr:MAG: T9SS C-terminal target domain-containing protein [Ignavibacteriales bacterium]
MLKYILFLVLFTGLTYSQWLQQPSGVNSDLKSVFCLDAQHGFITGNAGTFIKTTDGGLTWNASTINPAEDYNGVSFINQSTGVLVGNGGLIIRTTNGGSSWNPVTSGVTDNLYSVSFNGMNGIIAGSSQTILYSTDGGAVWNTSQTGFFGGGFNGSNMISLATGFVGGSNSIFQPFVGKSTDAGINWEFYNFYFNTNEGFVNSIHFFNETSGLVAGSVWNGQGAISRTSNSGTDWNTTLFTNPLVGLDFPSAGTGYAVGYLGSILKSTNSGISWISQTSGTSANLIDVDFFGDELNGVAIGEGGLILTTNNGGIPVELISFTGTVVNNKVHLKWRTSSEINNNGFYIERNTDNKWTTMAFINGRGTSTQEQIYFYNDDLSELEYSGTITYRLKQVDYDGSYEYSSSVRVEYNSLPGSYALYQNFPNPFNPSTTIRFALHEKKLITLKVYNILGNEVMTLVNEIKQQGSYEVTFDGSGLSSGIYIYEMKAGDFSASKYLTLIK